VPIVDLPKPAAKPQSPQSRYIAPPQPVVPVKSNIPTTPPFTASRSRQEKSSNALITICRRFLAGEELKQSDKFVLRPSRSDLVLLWKSIESGTGNYPLNTAQKLERMSRVLGIGNPAKVYIGLKVFEELGLIALDETDDTLEIFPRYRKGESKSNLDNSTLLKRLQ